LSKARALLCPVIEEVRQDPRTQVAITVRGKVSAYVISAARLEQLEARERAVRYGVPPRLDDRSVRIIGDIAAGSRRAARELERAPGLRWRAANKTP
jgi:prevent-host-death family protein